MLTDTILHGDALTTLRTLPSESVHCIVTSPPYFGLRDYGAPGQLGLEPTPDAYVTALVAVLHEARRVPSLRSTLWLNLGDSYASDIKGSGGKGGTVYSRKGGGGNAQAFTPRRIQHGLKPKDLIGIPWRVAFALQTDGWYLRSDIIWHKPNCMPESVRDRPTKSHEYVFLLTKSERYYYDADAVREPVSAHTLVAYPNGPGGHRRQQGVPGQTPHHGLVTANPHAGGRNKRDVWRVATAPYKGAHFAVMPPALVEPCVLAGCPPGGVVLDPFMGAGTVGVVARRHSRHYLGIELNAEYIALAKARIERERQPVIWTIGAGVSA